MESRFYFIIPFDFGLASSILCSFRILTSQTPRLVMVGEDLRARSSKRPAFFRDGSHVKQIAQGSAQPGLMPCQEISPKGLYNVVVYVAIG